MKTLMILAAAFLITMQSSLIAQERINVTSLQIYQNSDTGQRTRFDLRATDSQQQPVSWFVHDSAPFEPGIPAMLRCNPCAPPQIFNTYNFGSPISVQFGQTSIFIKLFITEGFSDTAYIGPNLPRKRDLRIRGNVRLRGKLEIRDFGVNGSPLLFYDDDVDLRGLYTLVYGKGYYIGQNSRLHTGFRTFDYSLTDLR